MYSEVWLGKDPPAVVVHLIGGIEIFLVICPVDKLPKLITWLHPVSLSGIKILLNMGFDVRKPVFGGLRTTETQASLSIRTV